MGFRRLNVKKSKTTVIAGFQCSISEKRGSLAPAPLNPKYAGEDKLWLLG